MKYRPELPKSGWYTYGLFLDGVPFYIGKGSGKRALNHFYPSYKNHGSNRWKNYIINKHRDYIEIIVLTTHEKESDAFSTEGFLIASYGLRRDGGLLVNQTQGGEGASGTIVPEALKMKRGNSIRKFSEAEFWNALEAYFLKGISQESAASLLNITQGQFGRCARGETMTVLGVLEKFKADNPQIDFENFSKNRKIGHRKPLLENS